MSTTTTLTPEALQRAMDAACKAGEYAELPTRVYDALIEGWHALLNGPSDGSGQLPQAAPAAAGVPEHLDVRRILLEVVPGEEGNGEEVYAQSVEDVEREFSRMSSRIAELEHAQPAAQPQAEQQGVPELFVQWLEREMPAGTVIGRPAWWAPKLVRALRNAERGVLGGCNG